MKSRKNSTWYMTALALLVALMVVMGASGIGFVPLPVIKATTMHIPVILGAILLGPAAGAVLGAVFGLCSIWINTTTPGILSFAFSPFMSSDGLIGAAKSIWIALGCRILFGWSAGYIWKVSKHFVKKDLIALPVTAVAATLLHTSFVMGSIYILLSPQYAQAKNIAMDAVFGLIMGTVTASGIPEAAAAGILVTVLGKVLLHLMERIKR